MADIRNWSTTAASNTDIAPEGMAPGGLNDAIRAVQGELAQLVLDEGGTLTTGGTGAAYTLTLATAPSALADGLYFSATAGTAATGGSTTLAVTPAGGAAFTAKQVRTFWAGSEMDPWPGAMVAGGHYHFQYDTAANGGAGAYLLLNPAPPPGTVLQYVSAEYAANADLTTTIPPDDTAPINTEGTEVLTATITPLSATSKIRVTFDAAGGVSAAAVMTAALFINSSVASVRAKGFSAEGSGRLLPLNLDFEEVPGSTAARTYRVRVGPSTGTMRLNGTTSGRIYGGVQASRLVIQEIKA